jgi:hypothetical protein
MPISTVLIQKSIFVAFCFWPNQSIKMGGADIRVILFYAGSTTTDISLLLVALAPQLFSHNTFFNVIKSLFKLFLKLIGDHWFESLS